MAIAGITYNPSSEPKVVGADYDNSKMSKEDFLRVLLANLQWQDPLEAADINEFINNSVKLREMEVLNSFEDSVKELVESNTMLALVSASSLIGKKVQYKGNVTYVQDGVGYAEFKLDSDADLVKVSLLDKDGNVVDSQLFYDLKGGVTYPFEINNPDLKTGYYTVMIEAYRGDEKVNSTVVSEALVNSVQKDENGIKLICGSLEIGLDEIVGIGGA